MAGRPTVTIQSPGGNSTQTTLPFVFSCPIRNDVVKFVHTCQNKNKRQAYAISPDTGHQVAAESWGTGRAVSRIPRVPGGGTHRAGQGAFGNMCRGGRMFAPTKIYRKWHRKVNRAQARYAVTSAIAASAITSLVMARGHRVQKVAEIPLVVADKSINNLGKTKDAVNLLKSLNAYADVVKVKKSKKIRGGRGKSRNRRYVQRKGPLIVHAGAQKLQQGFRNIPGVEFCEVSRLNLLQLAPGGHVGRFIIWTASAFKKLDQIYGDGTSIAPQKKNFILPKAVMSNADLARIVNSDSIQSVLRPRNSKPRRSVRKKNPLKNLGTMLALNPYHKTQVRKEVLNTKRRAEGKNTQQSKKRKGKKSGKTPFTTSILKDF